MPRKFHEVARIDDITPMELWGGRFGDLPSLYLATSGRQGGTSRIYRHDRHWGDKRWEDDGAPESAETYNKMRDVGGRLFAFYETGPEAPCVSRALDIQEWRTEPITASESFVGGRALEVDPDTGEVWAGGSNHWNIGEGFERDGHLYKGTPGVGYGSVRDVEPGIAWEVVRTPDGDLWEFWHEVSGAIGAPEPTAETKTYRNGAVVANPFPALACADWFNGAMYACGGLGDRIPEVKRFNGSDWDTVLTMSVSDEADHVLWVPRASGDELWVTGQNPLQVYKSLDGDSWEEQVIPQCPCYDDTNLATAIGFYQKRVWVASMDADVGKIRVFVDRVRGDLIAQVI